jgi:CRP-like cAMP-binding protein
MGLDDDIAFFEQVPIFAALDRQALQILAIGAETKQLQSGAVLFYAGELADGGYIVQDGSLRLDPGTFTEGNEVIAGPGTLVGELALLTDMVCQATAIAKEPTTVIRISRSLFRKMLEGYPAAAVTLRDIMAKRMEGWQRELNSVKTAMEKGAK